MFCPAAHAAWPVHRGPQLAHFGHMVYVSFRVGNNKRAIPITRRNLGFICRKETETNHKWHRNTGYPMTTTKYKHRQTRRIAIPACAGNRCLPGDWIFSFFNRNNNRIVDVPKAWRRARAWRRKESVRDLQTRHS